MSGTGAGAVVAEVLAPEEELDGVPAGGDVGLAALLVGGHEHLGGDLGHARGVVDDAGLGVALDVVDVGLVERPGVDLALGPVIGVVDRAIVEAEGLGGAVQPRGRRARPAWRPRGSRRSGRRRTRRCAACSASAAVDDVGVGGEDEVGVGGGRGLGRPRRRGRSCRLAGRGGRLRGVLGVVVVGAGGRAEERAGEDAATSRRGGRCVT